MARTRCRDLLLAPLLTLLLAGSVAAAPVISPRTLDEVRTAADRGLWLTVDSKTAEALRNARTDDNAVWELRTWRGEALTNLARYDEARALLQPELPARLAQSRIAVRRLLALVALSFYLGDGKAAQYAEQAQQLAEAHHPFLLPNALLLRSYLVPDPDPLLRRALRLAKKNGNEFAELNILFRTAHARVASGHYVEAIHGYESLLKRVRAIGYERLEMKIEGEFGWALREIGDYEQSTPHLERAVQMSDRLGALLDRPTFIINLGNNAFDRDDFTTAERYYRIAYEQGKAGRQLGFVLHNLAEIMIASGRYDEARRLAAEEGAVKKKLGEEESLLLTRIIDSRIATETGDYEKAQKIAEGIANEARKADTRWQAQVQMGIVYAAEKRNDEADQQFRSALATLRDARSEIKEEPLRLSFNNRAGDFLNEYVDFLIRLHRDEDALRVVESIQAQTLEEGLGIKSSRRDPKTIARETGATILDYRLGKGHSYVWTITPDSIKAATLPPRSKIHQTIDAYVRDLVGPAGSSMSRGTELYRMLVEPTGVRGGPVIVIPDGRMNVLNLETLVVPAPKPHYWIEDVVLRNAPSLQLLGRQPQAEQPVKSALVIGNAPKVDPAYPALTNAGREIEVVARRFKRAVVLAGPKATPAAYREASPQSFDVIHFVAHGDATIENPFDSAVILGRDTSGYKLSASDIIRQPVTARLVTLSSCYGAGKRTYVGEGLVGLAWAFVRAGAHEVIAAVWEVNDAATPDLMDTLYASMNAGRDPAIALRDAKLKLIRTKGLKPKYWAPFVLYSGM